MKVRAIALASTALSSVGVLGVLSRALDQWVRPFGRAVPTRRAHVVRNSARGAYDRSGTVGVHTPGCLFSSRRFRARIANILQKWSIASSLSHAFGWRRGLLPNRGVVGVSLLSLQAPRLARELRLAANLAGR